MIPLFDGLPTSLKPRTGSLFLGQARHTLAFWFLCNTFYHELGHHYRYQYRHKRKRAYWKEEEIVATLHGSRLTEDLFKTLRARIKRDEVAER